MKRHILILTAVLFAICVQVHADETESYFDDETRWTELRLDTTKYDSWFTEATEDGQTKYMPNYERVDYYVRGDTVYWGDTYRYVWQHREGKVDSIRFVVMQNKASEPEVCYVTMTFENEYNGQKFLSFHNPTGLYDFDWHIGKALTFEDIFGAACTCFPVNVYTFGAIMKIESATFGTARTMEYMDVDSMWTYYGGMLKDKKRVGTKLIKGIGVTSWDSDLCLFGPACPPGYFMNGPACNDHYRSILVHFERGGETIYDLWPTPDGGMASHVQGVKAGSSPDGQAVYDLQGRKVEGKPSRGIYVIGGKVMVK